MRREDGKEAQNLKLGIVRLGRAAGKVTILCLSSLIVYSAQLVYAVNW